LQKYILIKTISVTTFGYKFIPFFQTKLWFRKPRQNVTRSETRNYTIYVYLIVCGQEQTIEICLESIYFQQILLWFRAIYALSFSKPYFSKPLIQRNIARYENCILKTNKNTKHSAMYSWTFGYDCEKYQLNMIQQIYCFLIVKCTFLNQIFSMYAKKGHFITHYKLLIQFIIIITAFYPNLCNEVNYQ